MTTEVSRARLLALRAFFLLICVAFGASIWPAILDPATRWGAVEGVTYSFYGAFSALCFLGVLHPLKMLPLLLIQLAYKSIWLAAVGLRLWQDDALDALAMEFVRACAIGAVIDLLIIPWPHVIREYVRGPYRFARPASGDGFTRDTAS